MSPNTISARLLVLSDTHNLDFSDNSPVFNFPGRRTDVLLHCGNLTICGGLSAYKKCLKMLGSIEAELKLVITENHDLSLDGPYWQANLEEDDDSEEHSHAIEIMTGSLAKESGVTHLKEGTHTFTLQNRTNFTIYVSPYQPEFGNLAFPCKRDQDRFNTTS